MLRLAIAFTVLSQTLVLSAPLQSCASQILCLDIDVTAKGNQQHEICLFWRSDLPECTKDDSISHACPITGEGSKKDPWYEGPDEALCDTVSCGGTAIFAIKDGSKCADGALLAEFGLDGYDKEVTCYDGDGGDCSSKNSKACRWIIPAPDCDETTTTTTTTSAPEETAPEETAPEETAPEETLPEETAPEETPPEETSDDIPSLPSTTTEPDPESECACNAFSGVSECLSQSGCGIYSNEGDCFCHYCDCDVINEMTWSAIDAWDDIVNQCNDCIASGCGMVGEGCADTGGVVANTYSRDTVSGLNIDPNFIPDEWADDLMSKHIGMKNETAVVVGILTIVLCAILIACAAFNCYQYQEKHKLKKIEQEIGDNSEDEQQVNTSSNYYN